MESSASFFPSPIFRTRKGFKFAVLTGNSSYRAASFDDFILVLSPAVP